LHTERRARVFPCLDIYPPWGQTGSHHSHRPSPITHENYLYCYLNSHTRTSCTITHHLSIVWSDETRSLKSWATPGSQAGRLCDDKWGC
jgi:hypothetical protein